MNQNPQKIKTSINSKMIKQAKGNKPKQASLPTLLKKAQKVFNEFIRLRDRSYPCISCGNHTELQAGHYYSAGKHNSLRFNEDNCNGQCLPCNYYLSGNLLNYRENLIRKIGVERLKKLDFLASAGKRNFHKWQRYELELIIKEYSEKIKTFKP